MSKVSLDDEMLMLPIRQSVDPKSGRLKLSYLKKLP